METTETIIEKDESKAYELAYLLSPFVPADTVEKTMSEIFARTLAKSDAKIVTELQPKMRPLAYTIVKHIANKKNPFKDAYFGWLKFTAMGDSAKTIKEALDKEDLLVRFMIVHALKASPKAGFRRGVFGRKPMTDTVVNPSAPVEKGPEMTKEDIDREIATLLVGAEAEKVAE